MRVRIRVSEQRKKQDEQGSPWVYDKSHGVLRGPRRFIIWREGDEWVSGSEARGEYPRVVYYRGHDLREACRLLGVRMEWAGLTPPDPDEISRLFHIV
jgi:hypothetical protein